MSRTTRSSRFARAHQAAEQDFLEGLPIRQWKRATVPASGPHPYSNHGSEFDSDFGSNGRYPHAGVSEVPPGGVAAVPPPAGGLVPGIGAGTAPVPGAFGALLPGMAITGAPPVDVFRSDLPLPKDFHLLPDVSQQLLRIARSTRAARGVKRSAQMAALDGSKPGAAGIGMGSGSAIGIGGDRDDEGLSDDGDGELGRESKADGDGPGVDQSVRVSRWVQVPRHFEEPERTYLAKRRIVKTVQVVDPSASASAVPVVPAATAVAAAPAAVKAESASASAAVEPSSSATIADVMAPGSDVSSVVPSSASTLPPPTPSSLTNSTAESVNGNAVAAATATATTAVVSAPSPSTVTAPPAPSPLSAVSFVSTPSKPARLPPPVTRLALVRTLDPEGQPMIWHVMVPANSPDPVPGEIPESELVNPLVEDPDDPESLKSADIARILSLRAAAIDRKLPPGTIIGGIGLANRDGKVVSDVLLRRHRPQDLGIVKKRGGPGRGKKKIIFRPVRSDRELLMGTTETDEAVRAMGGDDSVVTTSVGDLSGMSVGGASEMDVDGDEEDAGEGGAGDPDGDDAEMEDVADAVEYEPSVTDPATRVGTALNEADATLVQSVGETATPSFAVGYMGSAVSSRAGSASVPSPVFSAPHAPSPSPRPNAEAEADAETGGSATALNSVAPSEAGGSVGAPSDSHTPQPEVAQARMMVADRVPNLELGATPFSHPLGLTETGADEAGAVSFLPAQNINSAPSLSTLVSANSGQDVGAGDSPSAASPVVSASSGRRDGSEAGSKQTSPLINSASTPDNGTGQGTGLSETALLAQASNAAPMTEPIEHEADGSTNPDAVTESNADFGLTALPFPSAPEPGPEQVQTGTDPLAFLDIQPLDLTIPPQPTDPFIPDLAAVAPDDPMSSLIPALVDADVGGAEASLAMALADVSAAMADVDPPVEASNGVATASVVSDGAGGVVVETREVEFGDGGTGTVTETVEAIGGAAVPTAGTVAELDPLDLGALEAATAGDDPVGQILASTEARPTTNAHGELPGGSAQRDPSAEIAVFTAPPAEGVLTGTEGGADVGVGVGGESAAVSESGGGGGGGGGGNEDGEGAGIELDLDLGFEAGPGAGASNVAENGSGIADEMDVDGDGAGDGDSNLDIDLDIPVSGAENESTAAAGDAADEAGAGAGAIAELEPVKVGESAVNDGSASTNGNFTLGPGASAGPGPGLDNVSTVSQQGSTRSEEGGAAAAAAALDAGMDVDPTLSAAALEAAHEREVTGNRGRSPAGAVGAGGSDAGSVERDELGPAVRNEVAEEGEGDGSALSGGQSASPAVVVTVPESGSGSGTAPAEDVQVQIKVQVQGGGAGSGSGSGSGSGTGAGAGAGADGDGVDSEGEGEGTGVVAEQAGPGPVQAVLSVTPGQEPASADGSADGSTTGAGAEPVRAGSVGEIGDGEEIGAGGGGVEAGSGDGSGTGA